MDRLTDECSPIADRLTVAAKSWTRPDAMDHRDPVAETELLLDTMNELNFRRLRIADLEAAMRRIAFDADLDPLAGDPGRWPQTVAYLALGGRFEDGVRVDGRDDLPRSK